MTEKYKLALLNAIAKHSKVNHSYIQAFLNQNGYVSKKILPAFIAAPIGKNKWHKMHSAILKYLIETQIILEFSEDDII